LVGEAEVIMSMGYVKEWHVRHVVKGREDVDIGLDWIGGSHEETGGQRNI